MKSDLDEFFACEYHLLLEIKLLNQVISSFTRRIKLKTLLQVFIDGFKLSKLHAALRPIQEVLGITRKEVYRP